MRIQCKLRKIRRAEDLPTTTLVVIGLWNMGYTDLRTVAQLLWMVDLKPLRRLFKMLQTSKDPLIRQFVDVGLPRGVSRQLPPSPGPSRERRRVRCKICGYSVDFVPCPKCSCNSPPGDDFPFRERRRGGCKNSSPTNAAPGSKEKLEVLRQRAENGEQLFQPGDKKIRITKAEMKAGHSPISLAIPFTESRRRLFGSEVHDRIPYVSEIRWARQQLYREGRILRRD